MSEADQVDPAAAAAAPPPSGVLAELGQLGHAAAQLFGAQRELLSAEVGLARSTLPWMLLAGVAVAMAAAGMGLTVLALAGVLLADWFASWAWALVTLAVLQLLFMLAAFVFLRRCMHSMTLPVTRAQWSEMMRQTKARARRQAEGEDTA